MIPGATDHATIARGNMLRQFRGASRLRSLVYSLAYGLNGVDAAYQQLVTLRTIDTASGKQLDEIGVILGQSRNLQAVSYIYFGFEGQTASDTFGKAPLRDINQAAGYSTAVPDDVYRLVLKAKILLNSGACTVEDIIKVCKTLFSPKNITVDTSVPKQVTVALTPSTNTPATILASASVLIPVAAGITLVLEITDGS